MSKPKHITMAMWTEAGSFDAIAQTGDSVDDEIVEQFRNSLPPVCNREGFMQAGGAYDHIKITGKDYCAPTYTTFKKYTMPSHPDGIWVYMGNCLRFDTRDCTNLNEISL